MIGPAAASLGSTMELAPWWRGANRAHSGGVLTDRFHGGRSRTNFAFSRRSMAKGVTHLMPRPMQASGTLIFFVEVEAISWVTTVWPWASA